MEIHIQCQIDGRRFSPVQAERRTGLRLDEKMEVGDIEKLGRNRGKSLLTGSCLLVPEGLPRSAYGPRLEKLITVLESHIGALRKCGATNFVIQMSVAYDSQCNLEFSPDEMKRLSQLDIPLAVTCYLKQTIY